MRAKLFMNGNSQAVRIPAEMRFDGDEVLLEYDPVTHAVTLRPTEESREEKLRKFEKRLREMPYDPEGAAEYRRVMKEVEDEDPMPREGHAF